LKKDLIEAVNQNEEFIKQYWTICNAMEKYQANSPQSANAISQMATGDIDFNAIPPTVLNILKLGTEINNLLADYIEKGKQNGFVRADIEPMKTVYIMWSSITSLLALVQTKGELLEKEFSISKSDFLEYGYKQIINSVLQERI
jgi:hypothetical protein